MVAPLKTITYGPDMLAASMLPHAVLAVGVVLDVWVCQDARQWAAA